MTKIKSTKRALLMSALALVMCFSMLIGSTFAWFTDSVTSGNNVIKSGNLNVTMSYLASTKNSKGQPFANFEYYYQYPNDAQWVDVESEKAKPIFSADQIWEPGYLDSVYLKIENKGNLNLQYNLTIVPNGEVGNLAEVIDVYYQVFYKTDTWNSVNGWSARPLNVYPVGSGIDGSLGYDKTMKYAGTLQDFIDGKITVANDQVLCASNYTDTAIFRNMPHGTVFYSVALKMRESAGNEYQNSSIGDSFDVRLVATQAIGERDSYSNDYDAKAEYPGELDKEGLAANTDAEAKTVKIETAAQMFAFADSVNNGKNSYAGYTVTLEKDIDLANAPWTPIGQTDTGIEFKGTFDGQGHTIKNLYINSAAQSDNYSSGLFGWIESHGQDITIKNVNVDGATVIGHHNVAVIAGYLEGDSVVENCNVTNATLTNTHADKEQCGDKTGVIAGYAAGEVTVKGCSATDCTVAGGRDAGQLIGASYAVPVDCSATNVTVSATTGCTDEDAGKNVANDLVGRKLGTAWN